MNQTRTTPILRWPGGKSRLLKKILPQIKPHVCYCEPFAGGLAVLFAKERSQVEVINDINGDLIALYLSAQRHLPELYRQIEKLVISRQLFYLIKKNPGMSEIERAANFIYRNRISFGGGMNSFAVRKTKGGDASLNRQKIKALLAAAHDRLDRVVIENQTYDRILENYDSKDTFFFFDPPYLNANPGAAYSGWSEGELRTFRRNLDGVKGNWMVTLDDSPFNRDLFSGCKIEGVETRNMMVNIGKTSGLSFGEILITP